MNALREELEDELKIEENTRQKKRREKKLRLVKNRP